MAGNRVRECKFKSGAIFTPLKNLYQQPSNTRRSSPSLSSLPSLTHSLTYSLIRSLLLPLPLLFIAVFLLAFSLAYSHFSYSVWHRTTSKCIEFCTQCVFFSNQTIHTTLLRFLTAFLCFVFELICLLPFCVCQMLFCWIRRRRSLACSFARSIALLCLAFL